VNGLGLSSADAEAKSAIFEAAFPLLPDNPDIFHAWKKLVTAAGVLEKQVHDARLVAICHVHGVSHLLTFNLAHFAGLASHAPTVIVVDPASI
jgi:predicted nucleic acid-binding protein